MYLFFVDESGDPGPPKPGSTKNFLLGGLALPADDWPQMRDALCQVKARAGLDPRVEVKWAHTAPGNKKPQNPLLSFSPAQRQQFAKDVLGIVAAKPQARIIVTVVRKDKCYAMALMSSPNELFRAAYWELIRAYQKFLEFPQSKPTKLGLVIQDQGGVEKEGKLRQIFHDMKEGIREIPIPQVPRCQDTV